MEVRKERMEVHKELSPPHLQCLAVLINILTAVWGIGLCDYIEGASGRIEFCFNAHCSAVGSIAS